MFRISLEQRILVWSLYIIYMYYDMLFDAAHGPNCKQIFGFFSNSNIDFLILFNGNLTILLLLHTRLYK